MGSDRSSFPGSVGHLVLLLLIVFVFWTQAFLRAYRRIFHFLPTKLFHKVDEIMGSTAQGLSSIKNAQTAFWIALTSLLQWTLMGAMVYISLVSLGAMVESPGINRHHRGVGPPGRGNTLHTWLFWGDPACFLGESADVWRGTSRRLCFFRLLSFEPVYPGELVGLYYANRLGLGLKQIEKRATEEEKEG